MKDFRNEDSDNDFLFGFESFGYFLIESDIEVVHVVFEQLDEPMIAVCIEWMH